MSATYRVAVTGPHGSGYGQPIEADSDADAMAQVQDFYVPGIGEGTVVHLVGPDGSTVAEYRRRMEDFR